MNSENDIMSYRRPSTSAFRRDNTVRSSLRMISNRWKQSTKASLIKSDATRSTELILPVGKWHEDDDATRSNELILPVGKWHDDAQLKTSGHADVFITPKADIRLELPIDKDLFNQRTSMFLMNSNFKLLKRSMSVKNCGSDDVKGVQRTATIRKGSVWANSTSKINLPGIVSHNFPQKTNTNVTPKTNYSKQVEKNPNLNMEFLMPYPRQNQPAKIMQFASVKKYEHTNIIADDKTNSMTTTEVIHSDLYQNNKRNNKLLQHEHLHSKMTKKQLKSAQAQLDKLTQINIHLHALFAAVENGHLDKARTILESTDVDVNSLNSDGLSPLDVAVLSNNRSLTKMLLEHGAIEGTQIKNSDTLGNHLISLLHDAENRIHELGSGAEDISQTPFSTRASFSSIIGNAYPGPSVTGCAGNEADKQIGIWERRVKGLRRMLLGWDQAM